MTYEYSNGVTLGAVQIDNHEQHFVVPQGKPAITKLAIELQWNSDKDDSTMRTPIVRGSPYTSVIYENGALPRIYAERPLKDGMMYVDQSTVAAPCGNGRNVFAEEFTVERELKIELDQSDMTWLIFVSSPVTFKCSSHDSTEETRKLDLPPGVIHDVPSILDIQATNYDAKKLMVRLAMANNCTTGQNPQCKRI